MGFIALPLLAGASQISVPSAPGLGYFLISTTTGNYQATTTDPIHAGFFFGTSTATSTFNGGLKIITGGETISTLTGCNTTSALITDNSGGIGCGSVSSFSYPFVSFTTYGTTSSATSSSLRTAGAFYASSTVATSTFDGGFQANLLNITSSSASSSFTNGIDLVNGCYSIGGTCLQTIVSSGSAFKQATKYATVAALAGTPGYTNGVAGVGATLIEVGSGALSIDSANPAVGDRVLIKNEASQLTNGIYTVTVAGSGIASYTLTRATDYNSPSDVFPGVANFNNTGTVNANTCWILTNTSAVTIGVTALTYDDACGAGSFSGTWPIILTGTTFSFGGLSTTTALTKGNLDYTTGVNTISDVATTTLSGGGPITVSNSPVVIGASGAVLGCATCATFGYPWTAFTTWGTTTISTTTSIRTVGAFYASSTVATSTFDGGLKITGGGLTVPGIVSSLIVTDSAGNFQQYGGASACSSQFVTAISASGGTTCASLTTALLPGIRTLGNLWFDGTNIVATGTAFTVGNLIATTTATSTFAGAITVAGQATSTFTKGISFTAASTSATSTFQGLIIQTGGLTIPTVVSALHLADSAGGVKAYGGATSCSNQVMTGFSAVGASTCTSLTDAFIAGVRTLGNVWYDGSNVVATSSVFTVGSLIGTTTATSTFAGAITVAGQATSTFTKGISFTNFNSTGTATSTAANGINLSAGCFALNSNCIPNSTNVGMSVETPSGTINSSNTVFTTTNNPSLVELNGAYQTAGGVDYTLTGSGPYTETFVLAPTTGGILRSLYSSASLSQPVTLLSGGTATSSFYSGGVVFANSTQLTQATNAGANIFTWDNTNSRLGIGTTTPGAALGIVSNTNSLFTLSTTSPTMVMSIDNAGHLNFGGYKPAISSCGSGSPVVNAPSSDTSGWIHIGTGAVNACTLTWAVPQVNAPHCFVNINSAAATATVLIASTTATTMVLHASASNLGGAVIDYFCPANQ